MSYDLNLSLGQKQWCDGNFERLGEIFRKMETKTNIKPIEARFTFGFYDVKSNTHIPTSKAKVGGGFVLQEQTGSFGSHLELVRDVRHNGAKDSVAIKCLANRLTMPLCWAKPTLEKSRERVWLVMGRRTQQVYVWDGRKLRGLALHPCLGSGPQDERQLFILITALIFFPARSHYHNSHFLHSTWRALVWFTSSGFKKVWKSLRILKQSKEERNEPKVWRIFSHTPNRQRQAFIKKNIYSRVSPNLNDFLSFFLGWMDLEDV